MPRFCNSCQAQGHLAVECPWGQRETLPFQATSRPANYRGRSPAVRRNVVVHSSSTLQQHPSPIIPPQPPLTSPSPSNARITNPVSLSSEAHHQPPHIKPRPSAHPTISTLPAEPPAVPPPSAQPHTPHKPSIQSHSSHNRHNQQRKSVSFDIATNLPQPNVEANKNFWDAVNRQVSILEKARLKASPSISSPTGEEPAATAAISYKPPSTSVTPRPVNSSSSSDSGSSIAADSPPPSPLSIPQDAQDLQSNSSLQDVATTVGTPSVCHNAEGIILTSAANQTNPVADQQLEPIKENPYYAAEPIIPKQLDVGQGLSLKQQQEDALERFKNKVKAQATSQGQPLIGSTSANPFAALLDDHSDEDDFGIAAASYNSDTDDGVEPIDMGYQSADGRSSRHIKAPSAMKINKRHPNIPLSVRLLARKSPYPSSP